MSAEHRTSFHWELAAEAITVRIRWFGLAVGFALVNFIGTGAGDPALLNAILALGTAYALLDTWCSWRGRVFLSDWPLVVSTMEAIFIGLLCHYDTGISSAFRFYYFLSLLVCAIRYSPRITWTTFLLHAASYGGLAISHRLSTRADFTALFLMLVLMGWVTWASVSFASLMKRASRRLAELNNELQKNQALLEERIQARTRELQESQALVVQQEKQAAFGLLAAGIAHEVGNPLAAISSLVQMLKRRHDEEYTRERLQMVDDQLRRIQRTLRELVDFSRPAETARSQCDIHELIEAALSIAKYYKRKKGKQIITRYAENLPRVRVVRDQIVQVFLNLVLNALDATDEGGTIEIATTLAGGRIRVAIRDDGRGVSAEDRERIFQPYFTTKPTGTGLGLFVCRRIVEQAGGTIELAETSPQGSTFAVEIPAAAAGMPPAAAAWEEDGVEGELEAATPAPVDS